MNAPTDAQLRALKALASGELRRSRGEASSIWRQPGSITGGVSTGTVSLLVRNGHARIVGDRTIKRCLITAAGREVLQRFSKPGDEQWQQNFKPAAS